MVRTRGLGRALGTVSGRGLGRGDHDDSDDSPQRRRPTASARRQRVPVTVTDEADVPATEIDVPGPDLASTEAGLDADEPMVEADIQDTGANTAAEDDVDTGAQAAEDEPEGFLGGPSDPSVLTEYADHVAGSVWTGEVFIIFNFS